MTELTDAGDGTVSVRLGRGNLVRSQASDVPHRWPASGPPECEDAEASFLQGPGRLDGGHGLGEADKDNGPVCGTGRPGYRHRFTTDLPARTADVTAPPRGECARRSMSSGVSSTRTV